MDLSRTTYISYMSVNVDGGKGEDQRQGGNCKRLMVVREGVVQRSLAVWIYHRGYGIFRCRGPFSERYGSFDATVLG